MSRQRVVPIVEGHGEQASISTLLTRLWIYLGGQHLDVLRPIRLPRGKVTQPRELARAVDLAVLKLRDGDVGQPGLVLIVMDADRDLPCALGPELLASARKSRTDIDIACVIANVEYETWFVAGAESLGEDLEIESGQIPEEPEKMRCGKGWVEGRIRASKYSETIDQPGMTARLDLELCRRRSPSFDKLCRELEARVQAGGRDGAQPSVSV